MPSPESSEPEIHSELAAIRLTQALIKHGEILQGEFAEILMIADSSECLLGLMKLAEKRRLDVDTIIRTRNGGY